MFVLYNESTYHMTINIYPRAVFLFTVEISGVVVGERSLSPPPRPATGAVLNVVDVAN